MSVTFNYPPNGNYSTVDGGHTINVIDSIGVDYSTDWAGLVLTLFCTRSTSSSQWAQQDSVGNPLPGIGQYNFGDICNTKVWSSISQYPVRCHLKIAQAGGSSFQDGEDFYVYNDTTIKAVTYAPPLHLPTTSLHSSATSQASSSSSSSIISVQTVITSTASSTPDTQSSSQASITITSPTTASTISSSVSTGTSPTISSSALTGEATQTAASLVQSSFSYTQAFSQASTFSSIQDAALSTAGSQSTLATAAGPTTAPTQGYNSLSTGTLAGIGVGAAAGGMVVLAILALLLKKNWSSRTNRQSDMPQISQAIASPAYSYEKVPAELADPSYFPAELNGSTPTESLDMRKTSGV